MHSCIEAGFYIHYLKKFETNSSTRDTQSCSDESACVIVHSEDPWACGNAGNISPDLVEKEKQLIDKEMERGVVYLIGEANVIAAPESSIVKKMVVDYVYTFLVKNLTEGEKALSIPKDQLLKVGITYEI
jgi:KUP system potassium uptake protein